MVRHAAIPVTTRVGILGYSLATIFSPVLYKVVHYFMENPIHDDTVLKYPVEEIIVSCDNYCIAGNVRYQALKAYFIFIVCPEHVIIVACTV